MSSQGEHVEGSMDPVEVGDYSEFRGSPAAYAHVAPIDIALASSSSDANDAAAAAATGTAAEGLKSKTDQEAPAQLPPVGATAAAASTTSSHPAASALPAINSAVSQSSASASLRGNIDAAPTNISTIDSESNKTRTCSTAPASPTSTPCESGPALSQNQQAPKASAATGSSAASMAHASSSTEHNKEGVATSASLLNGAKTGSRRRSVPRQANQVQCGRCDACMVDDCGVCQHCLEMPRFGGSGKQVKRCLTRPKCTVRGPGVHYSSSKCSIEGCDKFRQVGNNGMCRAHFKESQEVPRVNELPTNPTGAKTGSRRRSEPRQANHVQCGRCDACMIDDCGSCQHCLEMRRFGGRGKVVRRCLTRPQCTVKGDGAKKTDKCSVEGCGKFRQVGNNGMCRAHFKESQEGEESRSTRSSNRKRKPSFKARLDDEEPLRKSSSGRKRQTLWSAPSTGSSTSGIPWHNLMLPASSLPTVTATGATGATVIANHASAQSSSSSSHVLPAIRFDEFTTEEILSFPVAFSYYVATSMPASATKPTEAVSASANASGDIDGSNCDSSDDDGMQDAAADSAVVIFPSQAEASRRDAIRRQKQWDKSMKSSVARFERRRAGGKSYSRGAVKVSGSRDIVGGGDGSNGEKKKGRISRTSAAASATWTEPTAVVPYAAPREVYSGPAPDLPGGWTMKIYERSGGGRHKDKYWFSPATAKKFRSSVQVQKFLTNLARVRRKAASNKNGEEGAGTKTDATDEETAGGEEKMSSNEETEGDKKKSGNCRDNIEAATTVSAIAIQEEEEAWALFQGRKYTDQPLAALLATPTSSAVHASSAVVGSAPPLTGTSRRSEPRPANQNQCGRCDACMIEDCGVCKHCLDMPRFGGLGYPGKSRKCLKRPKCTVRGPGVVPRGDELPTTPSNKSNDKCSVEGRGKFRQAGNKGICRLHFMKSQDDKHATSTGAPRGDGQLLANPTGDIDPRRRSEPRQPNQVQCGRCDACMFDDCGACINCLDMPRFGGRAKQAKRCLTRPKCMVRGPGVVPRGDELPTIPSNKSSDKCSVEDCGKFKQKYNNGMCGAHFMESQEDRKARSTGDAGGLGLPGSTWCCHLCDRENSPEKKRCSGCRAWKGGKRVGYSPTSSQSPTKAVAKPFKTGAVAAVTSQVPRDNELPATPFDKSKNKCIIEGCDKVKQKDNDEMCRAP